jgi:uncharacterized protein YfaS (alpha-2-macroglobulin family)/tetratricopeptide (TPR) repeat protein
MRSLRIVTWIACLTAMVVAARAQNFGELKARAEKLYSEGSYAKAVEVYQTAKTLSLSPEDQRWVAFRLADGLWRAQAGTETADATQYDRAQHELEVLVRDVTRVEDHDRIWAEVQESLGDFHWTRRNMQNWNAAWPYYQNALDYWAGVADIAVARDRYLKLVWTMAKPPFVEPRFYSYGMFGNFLPREILENTVQIAQSEPDQARAHYYLAMALQQSGGDWAQMRRVPGEFEAALKPGRGTDWYDDALFNYANWMEQQGRPVKQKDGSWSREPDYPKALELYQRFVREIKKGESRYFDAAEQRIREITGTRVDVRVGNVFLPDSEVKFNLDWRNASKIDLVLYEVDLTKAPRFDREDRGIYNWVQHVSLEGARKERAWSFETHDEGIHKPGNEDVRLEKKPATGAYILTASAEGKTARTLVLVSDSMVVLKVVGHQALVYVCDALSGAPIAGTQTHLWSRYHDGNAWRWQDAGKQADGDGIAVYELANFASQEVFASALASGRQAFAFSSTYYNRINGGYKIYAVTDRPAYRPKETVQWKMTVRQYDGAVYTTPAGTALEYEITDPRGAVLKKDVIKLNAFGSAWSGFDLGESVPLGVYRITFWDEGRKNQVGNADLFRTEEYKLPEFKVTVQPPQENGRPKIQHLGDKVTVDIAAEYYFGGGVGNASVEVVVNQSPFYHNWHHPDAYPWFYDDAFGGMSRGRPWNRGGSQVVKRETIKTGADGHASVTFDTPAGGQDMEYSVEARVVDSSRREVVGNGSVRVTRQSYYIHPRVEHNIHQPNEKVEVTLTAIDANDQPAQAEGVVKVTREVWREVWLDPRGREVNSKELRRLFPVGACFPPPSQPGERPWRPKFQGYDSEEILVKTVKTGTNGEAKLVFTPEKEGYYRVAWKGEDRAVPDGPPAANVQGETTVWVAKPSANELGYHPEGLKIIADAGTFHVGEKAPVMLSVPTSDQYVLFAVEATDLLSYRLIHVTGDVKLIEVPIEEKHVPNLFLSASMVSDRRLQHAVEEIVVPPVKNFLTVDVTPDRGQYEPRDEGRFTVSIKDNDGKPVSAEVSFGVVDESIYYIQQDMAGDPRQFFYGSKRPHNSLILSTADQSQYVRWVLDKNHRVVDERELAVLDESVSDGEGFYAKDKMEMNAPMGMSGAGMGAMTRGAVGGVAGRFRMAGNRKMAIPASTSLALGAAAPASVAMDSLESGSRLEKAAEEGAAEPAVVVRSDFRSTVFWQPDVVTGPDGKATVSVKYPDSVTAWKAVGRAVTQGNQFGIADSKVRTRQPLVVRLQAPRFFLVGDMVNVSAVINNNTGEAMDLAVNLEAAGVVVSGLRVDTNGVVKGERPASVKVAPNSETRVDWAVTVTEPGTARLKVTARAGKLGDAMEKTYLVYEHGIEKFIARAGKLRGDSVKVRLNIPAERKAGTTAFTVQVSPSLAVTMLDALPYLIDYPYGCTEQTMSRFLPVAVVGKTLSGLGLAPEDVMGRVFGGIETNTAAVTHPKGAKSLDKMQDMSRQSLERLYDFQHGDGGWGWWKDGDSDHFMTAYVVWGMALARQADVAIKPEVLQKAVSFLEKSLVDEESNPDMQAWMLHALSVEKPGAVKDGDFKSVALNNLWKNRTSLNAYTRALTALAAHNLGDAGKARVLVENLENGVVKDTAPDVSVVMQGAQQSDPSVMGTAHWGEDGLYWRWSDGGVEATAFALRAILAVDPKNPLVEPVVNWLIKNRRGAQWSNTRDTTIVLLALNDYLHVSRELATEAEFEIRVNGKPMATKKVLPASILSAPSRYPVDASLIQNGTNEIEIVRKTGSGPLYFTASATFFSLEEPVTAAGNEIFVRRQYYKLEGRPSLLKGWVYERVPLNDGESVRSGDRIETVVTIESKNNYEYLLFEDLKPAGFEAAEVRSGEPLYAREFKSGAVDRKFGTRTTSRTAEGTDVKAVAGAARVRRSGRSGGVSVPKPQADEDHTGRTRSVYQELRDRKVAMFIDKLPQGVWEIKYTLRAETTGQFHALPVIGEAMYVPEIRCNGEEIRIKVVESGDSR